MLSNYVLQPTARLGRYRRKVCCRARRLNTVVRLHMRILFFLAAFALASCSSQATFRLEQSNQRTFAATTPLREGEAIRLHVTGLGAQHRLRFHRCGPLCNTAEPVATWEQHQIPADGNLIVKVPSDGEYYFWVEDFSKVTSKYGAALTAMRATSNSSGFTVKYSEALTIVAHRGAI